LGVRGWVNEQGGAVTRGRKFQGVDTKTKKEHAPNLVKNAATREKSRDPTRPYVKKKGSYAGRGGRSASSRKRSGQLPGTLVREQ